MHYTSAGTDSLLHDLSGQKNGYDINRHPDLKWLFETSYTIAINWDGPVYAKANKPKWSKKPHQTFMANILVELEELNLWQMRERRFVTGHSSGGQAAL